MFASGAGLVSLDGTATYIPRETQSCDALRILREHLPVFLARLPSELTELEAREAAGGWATR